MFFPRGSCDVLAGARRALDLDPAFRAGLARKFAANVPALPAMRSALNPGWNDRSNTLIRMENALTDRAIYGNGKG